MIVRAVAIAGLLSMPMTALAQSPLSGPTQDRSGLGAGSAGQKGDSANSLPSGALNAETGPQSRPAHSAGASTTRNPGAAFVRTTPKPAGGQALRPPGTLSTTTIQPSGAATTTSGGPGVGDPAPPPQ